ncbi:MAG: hypothetical protein V1495_11270 [Pseudomonadota bacterium]
MKSATIRLCLALTLLMTVPLGQARENSPKSVSSKNGTGQLGLPDEKEPDPARFSEQEKIQAIHEACKWLEDWLYKRTTKLKDQKVMAPHADYTHFNRVGEWSHKQLLAAQNDEGTYIEFGGGLFSKNNGRKQGKLINRPIWTFRSWNVLWSRSPT